MPNKAQQDTVAILTKRLDAFLKNNPDANIELEGERCIVAKPWADESVALEIGPKNSELISALNGLILPPQLTAIYHIDTAEYEFVFSVRPLSDPLWSRSFEFLHGGVTYNCKYGDSSPRLLAVGAAASPRSPWSPTDHRNLRPYRDYCHIEELPKFQKQYFARRKPMSFFFGPAPAVSPDDLADIARHLNFFMFYQDRHTPIVVIHRPEDKHAAIFEKPDEPDTPPFPSIIVASQIDPYILDLWGAANQAGTRLSFIYYYQILEYASFYFVEEQVRRKVARILKRPDILASLETCTAQLLDEIVEYRQPDEQKLNAVVNQSVDPRKVWEVVAKYSAYFAESHDFDGGFKSSQLIRKEWSAEDFVASWMPKLPDALRKIRNALVHSREHRMGQVIAPTRANLDRLFPWVKVIEEVACEVALYREA